MSQACGVDFGTSNSTVGWQHAGRTGLLALEQDKLTLPSVVFFNAEDHQISYGRAALADYLAGYEGRLMRSMKSLLGTSLIDGQTEVGGKALPFRELLSRFIGELKRRAEQSAGRSFSQAVFGRPVFFVDDNPQADRQAQDTLQEIAQSVGFREIHFQFEPIAAAFDYESRIEREELVLIADIGGGTSDFSLVRLSPQRAHLTDRRDDILGNGGVHIGGTDFDKYLSLAHVMPLLGMGGQLSTGVDVPSSYYFNLATWHTINLAYTQKVWRELQEVYRDIQSPELRQKFERLLHLVEDRDGHWLAIKSEEAKILLSSQPDILLPLERLRSKTPAPACTLALDQAGLESAIAHLSQSIAAAVIHVMQQAGVAAEQIDTIFFTGGSSGVRGLRQQIANVIPHARQVEGDLFGSIGSGLGMDAARRFSQAGTR
ncbi:Hsp70 family protein [Undibacterium oligocarboniphilum]|uniref:Hsp70 family protein n=1 Tax=Undibacterium oligocarboniphilum TaxID=666702 RepID=A0A850QJJ6_9BURK|nr:Hsp70 family protein [Undibacterium oligocarboniphilum]MBC3869296.1 Hsp70 family protein [Undibacterium oligocarboniphilum]NVO77675.1 Hsp70 family protein [Undibacterium oligocarboniphilum]